MPATLDKVEGREALLTDTIWRVADEQQAVLTSTLWVTVEVPAHLVLEERDADLEPGVSFEDAVEAHRKFMAECAELELVD